MKRKLVALFLISAMVLLAACGSSQKEEPAPDEMDNIEEAEETGVIEPEMGDEEALSQDDLEEEDSELEDTEDAEFMDVEDFPPPSGNYPDYPSEGRNVTTEGDPHPDNAIWFSEAAGMSIDAPKAYLANNDKTYAYHSGEEANSGLYISFVYLYPAAHDQLMAMDDDGFLQAEELSFNLATIFRAAPSWTLDNLKSLMVMIDGVNDANLEEVGKDGDYTIYAYVAESYPEETPKELQSIYEDIIKETKESVKTVSLYAPADYSALNTGSSLVASTTDIEGKEVNTGEIFANNKLTMVNCWASWCGPCIQEMPELEAMSKEFEEKGCQIIGVLMDGNTAQGLSDAKEIIKDTGVTYPNVVVWDGFTKAIVLQGYPTTFFVNDKGEIVGEAIIGANPEAYRAALEKLLAE